MTAAWLAIDTATDAAAVGVSVGERIVFERCWTSQRRHTVELAPAVAEALRAAALAPADLSGIAVALGPGSYTGLRIGLSLAKGLALGAAERTADRRPLPVVGIPTLDIVAAPLSPPSAARPAPLWAVLEAGRGRVIAARYPSHPGDDGWPDAGALGVQTVAELAACVAAGDWVAGELSPAARAALEAAGARVLPAAAGLRRPGWLAHLGRARLAAGGLPDAARLAPIYSGGEPRPGPAAAGRPSGEIGDAVPDAADGRAAGAPRRPDVVVRPMAAGDVDAVAALYGRSFATPLDAAHFARELRNAVADYVVAAAADGAVLGFAGAWQQDDEAHVMTIAVEPRRQGEGIGGRLLAALVEAAAARGLRCMTLEVRTGNAPAIALYRRFGFAEVGRRPRYYGDTGEDALIMTSPPLDDGAWRARAARQGVRWPP